MNRYRLILTFFIIGCLSTFLMSGVRDAYGAQGYSILPSPVLLGTVPVGASGDSPWITITNTGDNPFYILNVPKWAPPNRPWLMLKTDNCSDKTLGLGQSCAIMYVFSPYAVGDYNYQLNIQYTYDLVTHQNVNNLNVHMDGTAIKGTPTISELPNTGVGITFGQPLSACTLTGGSASVGGTLVSGSFAFTDPTIVPNAGNYSASITFTPNDLINYNTVTGAVYVAVAKANAIINVTPYNVTYDGNAHTATGTATGVKGEVLAGLNLSGTTHTNAGTYNDTWTFTDVTGNYNNANGTVNDVIGKATPIVIWDNPADITYPTALSGAQLNATANIKGTFTYTPDYCEVLGPPPPNSYDLSVTFTPDDLNYETATATVKINVSEPNLTKDQVDNLWICALSDQLSGYPVAMYLCPSSDCSCMAGDPKTNPDRCRNLPYSEIGFGVGELQWVGGGGGSETVDFVTKKTVNSVTSEIIYRCMERLDLCFSCGDGVHWSCNQTTPNQLDIPTVTTTTMEKIGEIWVCAGSSDESGCLTDIYSCPGAPDTSPCVCDSPVSWTPLTISAVFFNEGELTWAGPGSGDSNCETVYFTKSLNSGSTSCIYKCISDKDNCPPSADPDNPYCCSSYCSTQ